MDFSPSPDPRRATRMGLLLGALIVTLTTAGGVLFMRSEMAMRGDPGRSSRTPDVLEKMLVRAEEAEKADDRGAAIAAYRFVLAVGAKDNPAIEPYMNAARRGLARLGVEPQP